MSSATDSSDVTATVAGNPTPDHVKPASLPPNSPSGVSYVDLPDGPRSLPDSPSPAESLGAPSVVDSDRGLDEAVLAIPDVGLGEEPAARPDAGPVPGSFMLHPVPTSNEARAGSTPAPSTNPDAGQDSQPDVRPTASLGVQTRAVLIKRGAPISYALRSSVVLPASSLRLEDGYVSPFSYLSLLMLP